MSCVILKPFYSSNVKWQMRLTVVQFCVQQLCPLTRSYVLDLGSLLGSGNIIDNFSLHFEHQIIPCGNVLMSSDFPAGTKQLWSNIQTKWHLKENSVHITIDQASIIQYHTYQNSPVFLLLTHPKVFSVVPLFSAGNPVRGIPICTRLSLFQDGDSSLLQVIMTQME